MKKLIILPALAVFCFLASFLRADPSESGLEHRNSEFSPTRAGKDKIHSVPDTGSTLALMTLGCGALGFAYSRTRRATIIRQ